MDVVYLDEDDLLAAARAYLGAEPVVRDLGLLASAVARPRTAMYGVEAYPTLDAKAAAVLVGLTTNHALVDGNKRLGWVAVRLFYALNGRRLSIPEDEAYELVISIADGHLREVAEVGAILARHVTHA